MPYLSAQRAEIAQRAIRRRRERIALLLVGLVAVFLLLCCGGMVIGVRTGFG